MYQPLERCVYIFESTFDKLAYTGNQPETYAVFAVKADFIDIFVI